MRKFQAVTSAKLEALLARTRKMQMQMQRRVRRWPHRERAGYKTQWGTTQIHLQRDAQYASTPTVSLTSSIWGTSRRYSDY